MDIRDSVKSLKGVGDKKAAALEKLGIYTVEDMLLYFPRDYEDRRNETSVAAAREGEKALIKARVDAVLDSGYRRGGRRMLTLRISDGTGSMEAVFFNGAYLKNAFKKGGQYTFFGTVRSNFGKKQMIHPVFSSGDEERGILPVYPLTKGISQKEMRKWQREALKAASDAEDFLRDDVIKRNRLCSLSYAIENVHFPKERQKLLEARYRLIFDELIVLQTGLAAVKRASGEERKCIPFSKDVRMEEYADSLPFAMTKAQKRCVNEIERDLERDVPMNRLVQGDVGSGKTAVAEAAMYKAVKSGFQAVMMAPTEILARQHFEGIRENFSAFGIEVGFLSGSMKAAEKREVLRRVSEGSVNVLTGTHAVIQPEVEFKRLGLVITDEQHRFGVNQRIRLREKGENPNILVMTATPIPRTLAVVLYGDLDVSVIDELPAGRKRTVTRSVSPDERDKCYDFVEKQIEQGRQAYVVTPLIEESDSMDARSAQETAAELTKRFAGYDVALVHGGMKQQEKDRIMESFYRGDIQVLVATVVIEVGINVPNATVIVIENAERFGLAQLHQLRGRVGRGRHRSYCFLITDGASGIAAERAGIMESSGDGFYIAEEDMRLRGPGEIFGTRQHGLPDLNIADLAKHMDILKRAGEEARLITEEDPGLRLEKNRPLREKTEKLFGGEISLDL